MKKNNAAILFVIISLIIITVSAMPLMAEAAQKNSAGSRGSDSWAPTGSGIAIGVLLILLLHSLQQSWQDRKLVQAARSAGLIAASAVENASRLSGSRDEITIKEENRSYSSEVMIIGSSGYRSFVKPEGQLHEALRRCREAKIMLMDPREYGAIARCQSVPDPDLTPQVIREQVDASIEFIKSIRTGGGLMRLKLYPDMPLLKLAIQGDHARVRHYHTGMSIRHMPEYVFQNTLQHGGLYMVLYRYFLNRWQDPNIPEYDFDSDELVYRDQLGYEMVREPFYGMRGIEGEDRNEDGLVSPSVFH
jgi:hypothetical protein